MPWAAKIPCRGCAKPVASGYCEACRAKGLGKEHRDPEIKRLYGSARWKRRRTAFLDEHPLCVGYPEGIHGERVVAADVPDHIIPHEGDEELFFDEANWQPLCTPCNSRKGGRARSESRRRC